MVTFSRGGYLSFAFGLAWLIFIRNKIWFILFLLLAAFIAINPVLLPSGIRMRLGQTFVSHSSYSAPEATEENLEASSKNRVEIWKGAIQIIKEHPFTGIGYGRFPQVIQYYWSGGFMIDAHNTYLIIAAEMGLPTLFIFLVILLITFYNTFLLYYTTDDPFAKATSLGFLGGLFALLMSNMFGSRLDSQEVSSYFWILCALMVRYKWLDDHEDKLAFEGSKKLDSMPDDSLSQDTEKIPPKKNKPKNQKLDSIWNEDAPDEP